MRYLKSETFGQRYKVDRTGLALWLDQSDPRSYGDVANWYDLSGLNQHATQAAGGSQPAIVGADGLAGSSRAFATDFMDVGSGTGPLDITGDLTVFVWFQTNNVSSLQFILAKEANTTDRQYHIYIFTDSKVYFTVTSDGTSGTAKEQASPVIDTAWHLAVGVFDSSAQLVKISLDGGAFSSLATGYGTLYSSSDAVQIGNRFDVGASHLDGSLAASMIFSRALVLSEIQRIYLVDKPRYGGL